MLAVVSALLQLLPFPLAGPVPEWRRCFSWICLVPLVLALLSADKLGRKLQPWMGAALGYLAGVLWFAGNCYWIYQTMHIYGALPGPVSLGILILFSLYLGLYLGAFGWLVAWLHRRVDATLVLCLVPVLWVALELARDRITGFPWDLLGYTQIDNGALTQLAPLGGVMLLSFLVAAVNALVAWVWRLPELRLRTSAALAGVALVLLLQAGALYSAPPDATQATATLLQENLSVGAEGRATGQLTGTARYQQFEAWSLHPLLPVAGPGHRIGWQAPQVPPASALMVWPEAPADFLTSDPEFLQQLGALAKQAHTPVIAGAVGVDFDPGTARGYHEFGSAAVFNAQGEYVGRYDKIHRVPWGEYVPYREFFGFAGQLVSGVGNMEAGTRRTVFHLSRHPVGIFICYESIFGDEVRHFVDNGAQVLVNISDDGWYGDSSAPWQHLDMARMRAIENRRWLLRDTNTGVTTAIDPHGRGIFTTPRHLRSAFQFAYGYRSDETFYTRHGDWFAWLCALLAGVALLGAGGRGTAQAAAAGQQAGQVVNSKDVE